MKRIVVFMATAGLFAISFWANLLAQKGCRCNPCCRRPHLGPTVSDTHKKKDPTAIAIESLEEGGDLLSHLEGSTIGAGGLNFPVRNG
uniref:hypothetical protein n=1 Tax=Luteirhabdus pelagi TaxID=2792783 RepID=UPI001F2624BE